jgi:HEAT repeat protein
MGANDSTSQNSGSRDPIRARVLWPATLMLALIIAAFVLSRTHSISPVAQPAQSPSNTIATGTPLTASTVVSRQESLQSSQAETEPETARLTSMMLDKSLSLQLRRQAARSLARIGTDQAMAALKAALANDNPPYLKAAIAEALGESPNPQAHDLLHDLLNGKDETTARAAARGLALRGDTDAVETLGNTLFNQQTPLSVRTEAALALGDVNLPAAQDLLTRAISQIQDEDVQESVLDGLGRRPFAETESFFRDYLNSPNVPPASKVLAIEAITDADGAVGPFLSNYLNDANADVRAAAKSALDFLSPNP